MAIGELFNIAPASATALGKARRLAADAEAFVVAANELKGLAPTLTADERAALTAWFTALKTDLAARL